MLQAEDSENAKASGSKAKLAVTSQVRLGFASTYYTMAQALGLQKLQDFMRVRNAQDMLAHTDLHQMPDSLSSCVGLAFFSNFKWPNLAFRHGVQSSNSRAGFPRSGGKL